MPAKAGEFQTADVVSCYIAKPATSLWRYLTEIFKAVFVKVCALFQFALRVNALFVKLFSRNKCANMLIVQWRTILGGGKLIFVSDAERFFSKRDSHSINSARCSSSTLCTFLQFILLVELDE